MAKPKKSKVPSTVLLARALLDEALSDIEDALPAQDELSDKILGVEDGQPKRLREILSAWEEDRTKLAGALAKAQTAHEDVADALYERLDGDHGSIPSVLAKLRAAIHAVHGDRPSERTPHEVDKVFAALAKLEDILREVTL